MEQYRKAAECHMLYMLSVPTLGTLLFTFPYSHFLMLYQPEKKLACNAFNPSKSDWIQPTL